MKEEKQLDLLDLIEYAMDNLVIAKNNVGREGMVCLERLMAAGQRVAQAIDKYNEED